MKYALNFETEALGDTAEFDEFAEESTNSFWELDEYSDHECESCSEFDPEYGESEWEAEVMRGRRIPQRPLRTRPARIRPGMRRPEFRPRVIRRPGQVIAGPSVCTCPAPNCPRHGSEYVRWVQSALNQIMNLQLPVTGFMNAPTRSALRSFQEKQGLLADGIAGPETKDALLAAKGGKSPGAGATKSAEPGMPEPAEPAATPPEPDSAKPTAEFEFVWEGTFKSEIPTPAAAEAANGVLKRAGLKTTTRVDSKTAPLIQSALEQSHVLRPFIANKLKSITIPKNFVVHGWNETFDSAYLKLQKDVVLFGSKEEKGLINIPGFYHRKTGSIHLRPSANMGIALQLAIHKFSSPAFRTFFGKSIDDGLSLYFANLVLAEQGLAHILSEQYRNQLSCATNLIGLVGINMAGKAYFENHSDLVRHLTTNLSIGPVRTEELNRDALCTARFDNQRFQQRCKNFFNEYELSFNPDPVKFGVDNSPKMSQREKEERKKDVIAIVKPLRERLSARAEKALDGEVPIFPALPQTVKNTALKLSNLQFNLFRKWFPAGTGIHFPSVQHCFEQFANGELRDPSQTGHPGLYEPDSAAYFLFAEFAFLCLELGFQKSFWLQVLRTFVKTQEIFIHVYRESPKLPPPPVNDPVPPPRGTPRRLDVFKFSNFKQLGSSVAIGAGQSDLKRKMALRAKYDRMGESALKAAARDNLRRAQLMR